MKFVRRIVRMKALEELKQFLIARRFQLLTLEKRSKGKPKDVIFAQIQNLEAIIAFLNNQREEKLDMETLNKALEIKIIPISELKRSRGNGKLTQSVLDLVNKIPPNGSVSADILGENLNMKSLRSKIHNLKTTGKLPYNIIPIQSEGKLYIGNDPSQPKEKTNKKD